jgi:CMP-N-acetylneuraminic acid synthetase
VAVIPARGGSKRLARKNVLPVRGVPLIAYTIHAARSATRITEVVVSTDDPEISAIAERWGARCIRRPPGLCLDTSPIDEALRHALAVLSEEPEEPPTTLVWLQADVPIRQPETIDRAVATLEADEGASAVVTGTPVSQPPAWMKVLTADGYLMPANPGITAYRWQDLEQFYLIDGAVIAIRPDNLVVYDRPSGIHQYLGDRARLLVQPHPMYSLNIETLEQLEVAEFYLERYPHHQVRPD